MLTKEQVEALIGVGALPSPNTKQLAVGSMLRCDGVECNWALEVGLNFLNAAVCQERWTEFTLNLLQTARSLGAEDAARAMDQLDAEHIHWDWVAKSKHLDTDQYRWFFLLSEGDVEAVCITYHPKNSVLDGEEIFYIEYLAVAPWNKNHDLIVRRFSGVGTFLMLKVQEYFSSEVGMRLGFCLHSLAQAESFYSHIGMQNISGYEKDNLSYFEMDATAAARFVGGRS